MSAERLFRHRPLPDGLDVFDAHVNALPDGMQAPASFYSAVAFGAVTGAPPGRAHDDAPMSANAANAADGTSALRYVGGCAAPPAGVDLLGASVRLRDACAGHPGWKPLLRLDAGTGPRPATHALARVGARLGLTRRGGVAEGAVGRALLDDASLLDGFAGIKLMPQQTGLPGRDVLERIRASKLPVLVHAGAQCPVRWLEAHLLPALDGPVVLAHLGSWPCAADELEYALELAARDPRVHLETSGASIGNFVRVAAERVPERLLFGSNRPMCATLVQLMHVAASIEDDATLAAVAAGNAARVFGAPATGTAGAVA